jgi:hypothetical protein
MMDQSNVVPFSEVVESSEPAKAPDPFDFKAIRLNGSGGEGIVFKKPITAVPVRSPSRKTWFRCHPDPEHKIEVGIFEEEATGEKYLLSGPAVYAALEGLYQPVLLRTARTSERVLFLMLSKLPREDGLGANWALSAAAAGDRAVHVWVRMQANLGMGAYELYEASGTIPEPEWPTESLQELMRIAFHNRVINGVDHPVVRKVLRGAP